MLLFSGGILSIDLGYARSLSCTGIGLNLGGGCFCCISVSRKSSALLRIFWKFCSSSIICCLRIASSSLLSISSSVTSGCCCNRMDLRYFCCSSVSVDGNGG